MQQRTLRGNGFAALLLSVSLLFSAAAAEAQPTSLSGYVLFGIDDVDLRGRTSVVRGAIGVGSGRARLGNSVRVEDVVAPMIEARRRTLMREPFCRTLKWRARANQVCSPVALPAVATFPAIAPRPIDSQTPDATVPRSSTRELEEGAYQTISAGPRSLLLLKGGTYDVDRLRVASKGQVTCVAPCTINVRRSVRLRGRAEVGPGSAITAADVRINIFGRDGSTALRTSNRAELAATVYAPNGTIRFAGGTYVGAFVGARISTRGVATFQEESGF